VANEWILVIDDEPGVREALSAVLTDDGYRVDCVETGEEGIDAVEKNAYDAVLLDIWLPGMDGLAVLERLRDMRPDAEVVMISGHGTIETAVRATRDGAFDFIEKPLSLEKTLLVMRNALRQRRLERANRALLAQLARDSAILGHSQPIEELRRNVEVASESESPVLILGEQGSGRETVARRIHSGGPRAERAFVDVPCAALGERAAEEALFGGGEGRSRIEIAFPAGTLFVEDVDRLSADLQQRLAATLVDLARDSRGPRVIASAASDVSGLDAQLGHYLDVIRLRVPGLRERREDIPGLAEHFMVELAREYGRPPRRLSADCIRALQAWDWPGELRELRNLVERLLLFAGSETVRVEELPERMGGARVSETDLYGEFASLAEGRRAFETYFARRAMVESEGDRAAAAERLGVTPEELDGLLD
jgi:two-component system nitrogen regulation response regulator NtrX